jgi:signal transduction histidine kinase
VLELGSWFAAWSWLAGGSLLSGVVSLYFVRYLWPYREKPGARFFVATIACEALWALSYGVALLVFDPGLRQLFEIPIWAGINFIGVFFLAFALEYTGRGHVVRSKLFGGVALVQVVHTLIVATNSWHHVAWSNYHVEPVLGAATVAYTHQPWLFVNCTGIILAVAAGAFLLVDTFVTYGRLYRTQAAAIALSPVFPGLAFLLWLFEIGASPPLNLTALTFPVHLGFDMYAFFRRDMFELTPAARRAGDRAAIDDLGSGVLVVDDERRVVNCNRAASRLLAPDDELLGGRLDAFLGDVDLDADGQTLPITTAGERREYRVVTSPLADAAGNHVGHTIVLQDVTEAKQREERLMVLNRVLRHNLRNDLNVVQGALDVAGRRADDDVMDALDAARVKTGDLATLGEKARLVERAMAADAPAEPVRLADLLAEVRAGVLEEWPDASVEVDVPEDLHVRANPLLLRGVFENLVENAVEHTGDEPTVAVTGERDGESAVFAVRDDGPGIPEHERSVVESGEETALEHGSGLGLWFVKWGVASLGGEVAFETDGSGTTVHFRLPLPGDDADPA